MYPTRRTNSAVLTRVSGENESRTCFQRRQTSTGGITFLPSSNSNYIVGRRYARILPQQLYNYQQVRNRLRRRNRERLNRFKYERLVTRLVESIPRWYYDQRPAVITIEWVSKRKFRLVPHQFFDSLSSEIYTRIHILRYIYSEDRKKNIWKLRDQIVFFTACKFFYFAIAWRYGLLFILLSLRRL